MPPCPDLADLSGGNEILKVTCRWGKQNLLVKYLHRLNQNMYFLNFSIFTSFKMAQYMVKLVCFSISPHTTYRYILYWLPGKLTKNWACWNYAKLAPPPPTSPPPGKPGKCFPKSYVNPCKFRNKKETFLDWEDTVFQTLSDKAKNHCAQVEYWPISLKSEPNYYIALFGSDNISLRVISDWPFNEPMETLLPNFWLVADGAKRSDVRSNGCDVV